MDILKKEDGVADVFTQLVIGSVILFILAIVIVVSQHATNLIKEGAQATSEFDKLEVTSTLELMRTGNILGADVVSDIRFSVNDTNIVIKVTNGSGTYVYTTETYNSSSFPIEYDDLYSFSVTNEPDGTESRIYELYIP